MLKTLHVSNLGVLGDVEADFPRGLVCLTGETGAGKSLLVDAIKLLLGARADAGDVRLGEKEAMVEAVFDLSGAPGVAPVFEAAGYEVEDGEVHLRRIVTADGRGKAYIQGRLATSRELRDLGGCLVSVAGQHAFIGLGVPRERLAMLDAYAGLAADLAVYGGRFDAYRQARARLDELGAREADRVARQDYLAFVATQIEGVAPRIGEPEELAARAAVLRGAERLKDLAAATADALYEGAASAYDGLSRALAAVKDMARIDGAMSDAATRLESLQIEARDVAREVEAYATHVDLDPAQLAVVEDRIEAIKGLCRKHGGSVEAVLAALAAARAELDGIAGASVESERLAGEVGALRAEVDALAKGLTARRVEAAGRMSAAVTEAVRGLAMAGATLDVRVEPCELSDAGGDRVDFRVETNPGEGWGAVADVASGGELSRITLALYSVLSASVGTPVIVYDEIDAGVSGAVADRMGEVLAAAARSRQILAVTHHGQVAARAHAHFQVSKSTEDGRTVASLARLDGEARLREVARIVGGKVITERVLEYARELLGEGRGELL